MLRSDNNCFVGQKYKMKQITDIVRVLGLQVESENYLNPINISMNSKKRLKKFVLENSYLAQTLQMKQMLFFFAVTV